MANINKELNDIKNAVYGKEVRGSIHDGIKKINEESEEAKQKSEEAHDITQDLLDESFDSAALEANFEQRLDDEIANLQPEWTEFKDDITAQLAQIKNLKGYELNSKARKPEFVIVFESDDGHITDYTIAKPIFEEAGVPLNLSITTSWTNAPNRMTTEQLLELQNELGWEITSGLIDHTRITELPLHERERQLRESQAWFRERGIKCDNLSYPHGSYDYDTQVLAKKYYRSARTIERGHNTFPLETQELKSYWISTLQDHEDEYGNKVNTFEYYKAAIDDAKPHGGILYISFHSKDIFTVGNYQQLMRDILAYAKTQAPILTRSEALDRVGNIVDVGIYSRNNTHGKYKNHFVVGVDGSVSPNYGILDENEYTPSTPPKDFPRGVSAVRVTSDSNGIVNAPNEESGTLITYKPTDGNTSPGYTHQEYKVFQRGVTYRRFALSPDTWTDWFVDGEIALDSEGVSINTKIPSFNLGITYTIFTSNSSQITQVPEGKPGTLVSYIVNPNGNYGYSYQEYHLFDGSRIYKRRGIDEGDWGSWESLTELTLADDNSFTFSNVFDDFPLGVTYTIITGVNPDVTNAPEGSRGTLITHKITESARAGYSFQEYRIPNSGKVYQRFPLTNTEWREWHKVGV